MKRYNHYKSLINNYLLRGGNETKVYSNFRLLDFICAIILDENKVTKIFSSFTIITVNKHNGTWFIIVPNTLELTVDSIYDYLILNIDTENEYASDIIEYLITCFDKIKHDSEDKFLDKYVLNFKIKTIPFQIETEVDMHSGIDMQSAIGIDTKSIPLVSPIHGGSLSSPNSLLFRAVLATAGVILALSIDSSYNGPITRTLDQGRRLLFGSGSIQTLSLNDTVVKIKQILEKLHKDYGTLQNVPFDDRSSKYDYSEIGFNDIARLLHDLVHPSKKTDAMVEKFYMAINIISRLLSDAELELLITFLKKVSNLIGMREVNIDRIKGHTISISTADYEELSKQSSIDSTETFFGIEKSLTREKIGQIHEEDVQTDLDVQYNYSIGTIIRQSRWGNKFTTLIEGEDSFLSISNRKMPRDDVLYSIFSCLIISKDLAYFDGYLIMVSRNRSNSKKYLAILTTNFKAKKKVKIINIDFSNEPIIYEL